MRRDYSFLLQGILNVPGKVTATLLPKKIKMPSFALQTTYLLRLQKYSNERHFVFVLLNQIVPLQAWTSARSTNFPLLYFDFHLGLFLRPLLIYFRRLCYPLLIPSAFYFRKGLFLLVDVLFLVSAHEWDLLLPERKSDRTEIKCLFVSVQLKGKMPFERT